MPAYLLAQRRGIYDFPDEYADITQYTDVLLSRIMTLSQIEDAYELEIDRDALSEEGREVFDLERGERPGPRYWLNERADIAANYDRSEADS